MVGNMTKSLGDVYDAVNEANKTRPVDRGIGRKSLNIAQGTITGTSKGIGRILLAGFRSPFEVMLMAAQGFHNVPALYGDETVRPPERIIGIISGFEAMGKVTYKFFIMKSFINGIGNWIQSVGRHSGLVFASSRRCSAWRVRWPR